MQQKLIIIHLYSVFCLPSSVFCPLHLSRILYKSAPFYAKQTQFAGWSNEYILINNNGLWKYCQLDTWSKQTQFKPNQTQSPKSQNERKLNFNKGLQKKRWFLSPNKQTQFLQRPKMNVSKIITMNYKNLSRLRGKKTNPNKANPDLLAWPISNKSKVPANCSLTERNGFNIMVFDRIINKAFAEVTGAWWCPWSSKPVWGW